MIQLLTLETTKEKWFEEAISLYSHKISHLYKFERFGLKSKAIARSDKLEKIKTDSNLLLSKIDPQDTVILCDEKGLRHDSLSFSKDLVSKIESGNKKIVYIIGGAFGVSDNLRKRANHTINLAPFVMNHLVAQVVLMEQIYRGLSIWKGLPYHNE